MKAVYESMIHIVENDLEISVEPRSGKICYWIPAPKKEYKETGIIGIIEIGDKLSLFRKICGLAHEVGHCLFRADENFCNTKSVLFEESLAWYLGYKFFLANGIEINQKEYSDFLIECLDLYIKQEAK